MKRGEPWSSPIGASTVAWIFAALGLFTSLAFARLEPTTLVVTGAAVAFAFVPRLRPLRSAMIAALLATWALSITPWLASTTAWQTVLLFDAAALLAAEIAREEGLGVPIWRALRSKKVQGWAALVLGSLATLLLLGTIDLKVRESGLPEVLRWVIVPIALLCLAPSTWVGGKERAMLGAFAVVAVGIWWLGSGGDPQAEAAIGVALGTMQTLFIAGLAHEGLEKLRSGPPRSRALRRSTRIQSGEGVP